MKECKVCGSPINSKNRHRNHCYDCKAKYPYQANMPNKSMQTTSFQFPFNRKDKFLEDQKPKKGWFR